jgi:hypothetical protein
MNRVPLPDVGIAPEPLQGIVAVWGHGQLSAPSV